MARERAESVYGKELWFGERTRCYHLKIDDQERTMSNAHFTYFKIENFKRFDSIELTDIGQFNLIVGDNNVGKTSLLEAMLVDEDLTLLLPQWHKSLYDRGINLSVQLKYDGTGKISSVDYPSGNYLFLLKKVKEKNIKLELHFKGPTGLFLPKLEDSSSPALKVIPKDKLRLQIASIHDPKVLPGVPHKVHLNFENELFPINLHQDEFEYLYKERLLPIVLVNSTSIETLYHVFKKYIGYSLQALAQLVEGMKTVIPEVNMFKVEEVEEGKMVFINLKGEDGFHLFPTYGEGAMRVFQILNYIIANSGKRLFIDEIDTGIHHSRMHSFLKTVIKLAKEHDVQLFMTTHSAECQQAFVEVFEDTELTKEQVHARNYTLVETQDGNVDVQKFNFEAMKFAVASGFEIRGGG